MTIKNDKQVGTPFVDFIESKAVIEALPNVRFGAHAIATDNPTAPFGIYTTSWHWYTTGSAGGTTINAQDEGILLGQPSTFNFVGGGIDASISGTVVRVFVTGSIQQHNSLLGLQGGSGSQYYHLAYNEWGSLVTGGVTGLHKHSAVDIVTGTINGARLPREVLTATRTYFVMTTGNDSNTGLVSGSTGAFRTIQKALNTVATLDFNSNDVYILWCGGNVNESLSVKAWVGSGKLYLVGTPSIPNNSTIYVTGTSCIQVVSSPLPDILIIDGFKMGTTTSGNCLSVSVPANVQYRNVDWSTCAWHHVQAVGGGAATIQIGNQTISGNTGLTHNDASSSAQCVEEGYTTVLTGTPNWGTGYTNAWRVGVTRYYGAIFSGTATGKRFDVYKNGVIDTIGSGVNFLPGNQSGTTSTGGQYT